MATAPKTIFDAPERFSDIPKVVKINRCLDTIEHWTFDAMERGDHARVIELDRRFCAVEDQLRLVDDSVLS